MKRYSKPLGTLLDFKQTFFDDNDARLAELKRIAALYRSQPRRVACKNCAHPLDTSAEYFTRFQVEYTFCSRCGHCNGLYEDTDAFCRAVYTADEGKEYARNYSSADIQEYRRRMKEVYLPKADFLKDALREAGEGPLPLTDFGAGAGYFVSVALACGFQEVTGYEPSATLVRLGNAMIGEERLILHDVSDTIALIERSDTAVASFIGVLEHLQRPRDALRALSRNPHVRFVLLSVPLFGPTVVFESVFDGVVPRQLVGRHTHLYTERSLLYLCDEFGFRRHSEWWFGLDIADLYRSVLVSVQRTTQAIGPLHTYWKERVFPLIDGLQRVLDEAHACSEVHLLLQKSGGAARAD